MGLKIDKFLYHEVYENLDEQLKGLTIPEIIKELQGQLKVANNSIKYLVGYKEELTKELCDTKSHLRSAKIVNTNQEVELKAARIKLKSIDEAEAVREIQEETNMEVFKVPEVNLSTVEELLTELSTMNNKLLLESFKELILSQQQKDKERDEKLYEYLKNNVTYGIQKIGKGLKEKRIF